jgi:hypothetical protein
MIAESLTPKPGIREQNRHEADMPRLTAICPLPETKRTSPIDRLTIVIHGYTA